jgi:hypothetical protein
MQKTDSCKKRRPCGEAFWLLVIFSLFFCAYFSLSEARTGYCIEVTVNNSTMSSSWGRCQYTTPMNFQAVTKITGKGNFTRYESIDGFAKIGQKELSHGNKGKLLLSDLVSLSSRVDWIEINEVSINDSPNLLDPLGDDHYSIKINESLPTTIYNKQNFFYTGDGVRVKNKYFNNDHAIVTNYYATQLSKSVTSLAILSSPSYIFADITPARALETIFENRGIAFKLESSSNQYSGFGYKSDNNFIEETYWGAFKLNQVISTLKSYKYLDADDQSPDILPCCYDKDPGNYRDFGSDVESVFNCTCFKAPSTAQFQINASFGG